VFLDISMPHKASLGKVSVDNLAGSSFSTEGFGVYKSAGSSGMILNSNTAHR